MKPELEEIAKTQNFFCYYCSLKMSSNEEDEENKKKLPSQCQYDNGKSTSKYDTRLCFTKYAVCQRCGSLRGKTANPLLFKILLLEFTKEHNVLETWHKMSKIEFRKNVTKPFLKYLFEFENKIVKFLDENPEIKSVWYKKNEEEIIEFYKNFL